MCECVSVSVWKWGRFLGSIQRAGRVLGGGGGLRSRNKLERLKSTVQASKIESKDKGVGWLLF